MDERKQLKRKVIEAIHDCDYKEAIMKEPSWCSDENDELYDKPHISIGRVMAALQKSKNGEGTVVDVHGQIVELGGYGDVDFITKWKLLNDDGTEAVDDDQNDETIGALLKLFK